MAALVKFLDCDINGIGNLLETEKIYQTCKKMLGISKAFWSYFGA